MPKEIEKKYIVEKIPDDLNFKDVKTIHQTYLAIGNEEVRVRKTVYEDKEEYAMTIKKGKGLVRLEKEFPIEKDTYIQILPKDSTALIKTRKTVIIQNEKFDLDIYHNSRVNGLITIEIEFESEEEARAFVKPDWFGENVTEDKSYKNQSLWKSIQQ